MPKEKKSQPRIFYLAKIAFKNERNKAFSGRKN